MSVSWQTPFGAFDPLGSELGRAGSSSWSLPSYSSNPFTSITPDIGQPIYGYADRPSTWGQTSFDPSPRGEMYDAPSSYTGWATITSQVDNWLMRDHPELFDFTGNGGNQSQSPITSLGGDWAGVDQWNAAIAAAANATGVPANLIKAIMKLESGGQNLPANGAGALGPMQVVASIWGNLGYDLSDPAQNIMAGATILKQFYDTYETWATANGVNPWKAAVYSYYAGNPYNLDAHDDPGQGGSGMSTGDYGDQIWRDFQRLQQPGAGVGPNGQPGTGTSSPLGNSVVQEAIKYVGTPYVWGGIPGKGVDPRAFGGWDCSGFTYWLDQNYGNGQLPAGSHYQYQYAVDTGQLFTDPSGLVPGDLVFFNTGNSDGGGAELNNAGHVGIYIGDGQMLHAANPDAGTIVSNIGDYMNMYQYLGALRMPWSSGNAYTGSSNTYIPSQQNWSQFMRAAATGGAMPGPGFTPQYGSGSFSGWIRSNTPWVRVARGSTQQAA